MSIGSDNYAIKISNLWLGHNERQELTDDVPLKNALHLSFESAVIIGTIYATKPDYKNDKISIGYVDRDDWQHVLTI